MLNIRLNRINTIADGSCFLHAVLQCFNSAYINMNNRQRREYVKKIRYYLSESLSENNEEIYKKLSRNEIENISEAIPELKIENMKDYLKSNKWLNIFFLEFIANVFDIDIYIIDSHTKDLYRTGDNEIYYKKRNSIIIYYIRDLHFESVSVPTKEGDKTFFSHDSYIIQKLYKKLNNI